jgi:transketolase
MRNAFADTLYELGKTDQRICVVVADISPAGSIEKFRKEFPGRFINTGVSEQSMVGIAAGMALRGMRPFVYTIATFALFRPYEFVRDDLCYQNLPVTVVGIGGGVSYSTLGGTHHAQEDVSIACAMPNMTVIAPCDPVETLHATRWCATQLHGPVYLRLGRAGEPVFHTTDQWQFGKARRVSGGGSDVLVLSYGPIMKRALAMVNMFKSIGAGAVAYSVHTLKPLDPYLAQMLAAYPTVVVVEECAPQGSLSMRIKEMAWNAGAMCRIYSFTLRDEFVHCYGSHDDILDAHGLSVGDMWRRIAGERTPVPGAARVEGTARLGQAWPHDQPGMA